MQLTDDTLQRLVDGELSASEYQEALLALESDPTTCESNAWRRCALSFLESQAFELGAKSWLEARKRNESNLDEVQKSLVMPAPGRKIPAILMLLTVAASLAGAFWVGSLMGDLSRPKPIGTGIEVVKTDGQKPGVYEENPDGTIFVSATVEDESQFDSAAWVTGTPTPLQPEIQRRWEQEGFTVRASRRLIPVTLPDGKKIIAPFEQYEKVPRSAVLQ